MQFCKKCGAELNEESNFCTKCGAKATDNDERRINKQPNYNLPLIIFAILIVIAGVLFYFFKAPLLYSYHYDKALNEASTNVKLTHFNKALRYEQNEELLNNLFITLKEDSNFETEINSLSNLNDNNKSKLITDICIHKADYYVGQEKYSSALKVLKVAEKYDYNIKTYPQYDKIDKFLKDENEKKNKKEKQKAEAQAQKKEVSTSTNVNINYTMPSNLPANIYSYSDDYIVECSNYVYLTKGDLAGYSKETLALIRNEIYARHGYMFKTEPFKSYFNSKYWYTPNPYFNESDLNDCEVRNIALILKMEKS